MQTKSRSAKDSSLSNEIQLSNFMWPGPGLAVVDNLYAQIQLSN